MTPKCSRPGRDFIIGRERSEKAQNVLELILAKEPADVEATLALVGIFQSKGDSADSLGRIETALKLDIKPADREKLLLDESFDYSR